MKDQSYFLSGLAPHQLSRLLLPVGPLLKTQVRVISPYSFSFAVVGTHTVHQVIRVLLMWDLYTPQVRKLALRWGLPSAQRPDSQGLCFLGPLAVGPFLGHLLGEMGGPVLHFPSGALLGRHGGLWGFTAGQQKGVVPLLDPLLCRRCRGAVGGPPELSGPWSVVGKVPAANALFVVSKKEEAAAEARVRALAPEARGHLSLGAPLLQAAAKGDPGASLAVKLRQLRTHLRVDNIQWIGGGPPPEFVVSSAAQEGSLREQHPNAASAASAAAVAAVAAAKQGAAILSGRPPAGPPRGIPNASGEMIVQVRHSAAFDGVAKHKFKVLRVSGGFPGDSGAPTEAELLLEEPDVGLAPGQVAAFYRGDECLGSGRISALQGLSLLKGILEGTE